MKHVCMRAVLAQATEAFITCRNFQGNMDVYNRLRKLAGADAPNNVDEGVVQQLSLTLDGIKMVYCPTERRWTSDTSEMAAAADSIQRLVEENDEVIETVRDLREEIQVLRAVEQKRDAEMLEITRKNELLARQVEEQKTELLTCYASLKELKQFVSATGFSK